MWDVVSQITWFSLTLDRSPHSQILGVMPIWIWLDNTTKLVVFGTISETQLLSLRRVILLTQKVVRYWIKYEPILTNQVDLYASMMDFSSKHFNWIVSTLCYCVDVLWVHSKCSLLYSCVWMGGWWDGWYVTVFRFCFTIFMFCFYWFFCISARVLTMLAASIDGFLLFWQPATS